MATTVTAPRKNQRDLLIDMLADALLDVVASESEDVNGTGSGNSFLEALADRRQKVATALADRLPTAFVLPRWSNQADAAEALIQYWNQKRTQAQREVAREATYFDKEASEHQTPDDIACSIRRITYHLDMVHNAAIAESAAYEHVYTTHKSGND